MEWMNPDYDHRSLKELTENCSPNDFIRELIDVFPSPITPNVNIYKIKEF
jgi:hypothetical protein